MRKKLLRVTLEIMNHRLLAIISIVLFQIHAVLAGYPTQEIVNDLLKRSTKVIQLTDKNYQKYLSGPRDYHLVMLLSSLSPQFACPLCTIFKPEYEIVANSWYQDHPNGIGNSEGKDIIFCYSEFLQSKEFFQRLQLNNIPKLFYLAPSTNKGSDAWLKEVSEYQFFQGKHTELIVEWLRGLTQHKFNIYIPVNYNRIAINAAITCIFAVVASIFRKQMFGIIASRFIWMGISILTILLFNAGYMFNQIRETPYVREHADGKVEYFLGGQQTQVAVETQIVSFLYGILSVLFVLLYKQVPKISNPQVKLIAAVLVSITFFLGYGLFLNIFDKKGSGYPYKFFSFF